MNTVEEEAELARVLQAAAMQLQRIHVRFWGLGCLSLFGD